MRYQRGMCEVGESKAFLCLFLSGGFGLSNIVGSVGKCLGSFTLLFLKKKVVEMDIDIANMLLLLL